MKKKLFIFIIVVAQTLLLAKMGLAVVRIAQTEKEKYRYRMELANLLLEKTSDYYGPSSVKPAFPKDPTQDRCLFLLQNEEIDLMYLPPTESILRDFGVIKIDIHNGMLGYRVLIIRKEDQKLFSEVKNLEDLRKFTGGFGNQWNDFKIFPLNRLPVVGTATPSTLLPMLSAGRFDYFHRGLHEAWEEIKANKDKLPNLKVEETIALVYDYQVYFIFNKRNVYLKERFEKGFKIILSDGSFKRLFQDEFGQLVKKVNLQDRKIIKLKYDSPKNLPPINTDLWK